MGSALLNIHDEKQISLHFWKIKKNEESKQKFDKLI